MVAYKLDHALDGKASTQRRMTKRRWPLWQSIHRESDHGTHGSKASARDVANDNGGKASARETKDGQASTMVTTIAAKHPL
jgi:hypothetical protein